MLHNYVNVQGCNKTLLIKTFKPFTPMSDQDIISLYNINTESNWQVSRIKQRCVSYQLSKCGVRLVRLAYEHTKACLEALLCLQLIKCLDPTNFVLDFVKRSFKPLHSSYNPWYRVCDWRSQKWDLISTSFQPRSLKYTLLKFY